MGLPSTLGGIVGFLIAVIFIIGISATDVFPDESQKIVSSQNDFTNTLGNMASNQSTDQGFVGSLLGLVGLDGIYDFIRNFFSLLISFIVMVTSYLLLFIGISTIVPTEFYLLFALLCSGLIISLIKLIFLSGD